MTIHDTLKARNSTHGDFAENARISQGLKSFITNCPGYESLTAVQRESIDLICTKLARTLSGGANHADNWHDIAGYATLAEREVEALQTAAAQMELELATIVKQHTIDQFSVDAANAHPSH